MRIRGKERGFELNVQSHGEISELCRDKDFANFGELFSGTQTENLKMDMQIAVIMNKGFEDHKAFENPNYTPDYLTMDDMKFLTMPQIQELERTLMMAVTSDQATENEAEEPKPETGAGKKSPEDASLEKLD